MEPKKHIANNFNNRKKPYALLKRLVVVRLHNEQGQKVILLGARLQTIV